MSTQHPSVNIEQNTTTEEWINLKANDAYSIILSGVLKQVVDKDPNKKFNLVKRGRYLSLFRNHPAIDVIGFPPKGSKILEVEYDQIDNEEVHAYQRLAKFFGLKTPVKDEIYLPEMLKEDPILHEMVPWKDRTVMICPFANSPAKELHPGAWHQLVDKLTGQGMLVIQTGKAMDLYITGTYSLRGMLDIRQMALLMTKVDAVVTVDNYALQLAHMMKTPAVTLWGATSPEVYGYSEQTPLVSDPNMPGPGGKQPGRPGGPQMVKGPGGPQPPMAKNEPEPEDQFVDESEEPTEDIPVGPPVGGMGRGEGQDSIPAGPPRGRPGRMDPRELQKLYIKVKPEDIVRAVENIV